MIWKRCSGSGAIAIKSEIDGGSAMCPVCTKYVPVKIGQLVPSHESVVIDSQPIFERSAYWKLPPENRP